LLLTLGEELDMLTPSRKSPAPPPKKPPPRWKSPKPPCTAGRSSGTLQQPPAEPRRQAEVQQSRLQQLETSLERLADRQKRWAKSASLLSRPGRRGDHGAQRAARQNPKCAGRFADQ
jgi:chromosome segregation protein